MKPVMMSLFDPHPALKAIAERLACDVGSLRLHDFPDGESYVQIQTDVNNKEVILLNSLDRPNSKILPLILVAETLKALGARRVGLCAPYLAYMRQDKQFKPGEGITSQYFAQLVSHYFDWLVTVDPHLHRYHNLDEIYGIPNTVLHATQDIARWIDKEVKQPLLIGPDRESEQWVAEVAQAIHAPYLILEKNRHGDDDVEISAPMIGAYADHTPVLVDDIISTAQTMIEVVKHLQKAKMKSPVCVGVHAVFSNFSYENLVDAGAESIVTCNTIGHQSNRIDLSSVLSEGIQKHLMNRYFPNMPNNGTRK